jgi:hypothetical protein
MDHARTWIDSFRKKRRDRRLGFGPPVGGDGRRLCCLSDEVKDPA